MANRKRPIKKEARRFAHSPFRDRLPRSLRSLALIPLYSSLITGCCLLVADSCLMFNVSRLRFNDNFLLSTLNLLSVDFAEKKV
jgi:hypothetical protein